MFCLLKIAYDDTFHGFQIQPDVRTVQGEILKAITPLGITRVLSSSRTDSHVRSAATIIEVEFDDALKLCRIIDSIDGIAVTSYSTSESFLNLRSRIKKEYWYISPLHTDEAKLSKAIGEFLEGNISNFSRDRTKKVMLETISDVSGETFTLLKFLGKSFSWNFVRIAAESILRRSLGQVTDEDWDDMLHGKKYSRFKGSPENLILVDVKTDLAFTSYESKKIQKIRASTLAQVAWSHFVDSSTLEFVRKVFPP
ncbi:MAG: hypothetical protein QXO03_05370 [Thermoplasmatales archaeon]